MRRWIFVLLAVSLAWRLRFFQDDSYISLRYASNLASGNGLVWNVGERVEGYTNPLWTLLLAIPIRLGYDPVLFSYVLGLALLTVSLFATYHLAEKLTRDDSIAFAAMVATGSNYTFAAYATGGLETCLQTALVMAGLLLASFLVEDTAHEIRWTAALGAVTALALLTRLDSILLVGPAVVLVATSAKRHVAPRLLALMIPAVVVSVWLAWKWTYYGALLPNSFYLKASHGPSLRRGLYYVALFAGSYLLLPFPGLWLLRIRRAFHALTPARLGLLVAPLGLWTLYTIAIGGDFMEFRLAVPVLPIVAILAVATTWRWTTGLWRWALLSLFPLGSLFHAITFDRVAAFSRGVVTIPALKRQMDAPLQDWPEIGRYLRRTLGGSNATIAVTAAGAIPYYSGLTTVDMLGVNDPWVARHGAVVGDRPGHQRIATIAYLKSRNVDLILGHPLVLARAPDDPEEARRRLTPLFDFHPMPDPEALPSNATIVLIPFDPPRTLLGVGIARNAAFGDAARRAGWTQWPLAPPGRDAPLPQR